MEIIDIIRLRDGKYVEHWSMMNMAGLMAQLTAQ
jgi:predicted ester cyclase